MSLDMSSSVGNVSSFSSGAGKHAEETSMSKGTEITTFLTTKTNRTMHKKHLFNIKVGTKQLYR